MIKAFFSFIMFLIKTANIKIPVRTGTMNQQFQYIKYGMLVTINNNKYTDTYTHLAMVS